MFADWVLRRWLSPDPEWATGHHGPLSRGAETRARPPKRLPALGTAPPLQPQPCTSRDVRRLPLIAGDTGQAADWHVLNARRHPRIHALARHSAPEEHATWLVPSSGGVAFSTGAKRWEKAMSHSPGERAWPIAERLPGRHISSFIFMSNVITPPGGAAGRYAGPPPAVVARSDLRPSAVIQEVGPDRVMAVAGQLPFGKDSRIACFAGNPNARVLSTWWRRKRDSNPRVSHPTNGFQDRRLRPLGHSSDLIIPAGMRLPPAGQFAHNPPSLSAALAMVIAE